MNELFRQFATWSSEALGSAPAFLIAIAALLVWAITGPVFRYSEAWQLIVNTGTNIVTLLMVFLIQYSQNRDTKVVKLKLDELIKSSRAARNKMIDLDRLSDEQLLALEAEYKRLVAKESGRDKVS
ncbi:MAG TPA: low affinity iron permease family protein [Bryobacteraceae bacterium]|jgi:low affinity Fe/Cu permease|nr:low affinity iron permease family protein [Bryobacteraceae bacterium]